MTVSHQGIRGGEEKFCGCTREKSVRRVCGEVGAPVGRAAYSHNFENACHPCAWQVSAGWLYSQAGIPDLKPHLKPHVQPLCKAYAWL